jgi:hypothetical protein
MKNSIFTKSEVESLYYIKDRNNEIRWIFPISLIRPTFLNLYNSNTLKGFIYKILLKFIFKLKLQNKFVSGVMHEDLEERYKNLLTKLNCTNYSIFTGTPGENRKIVIEANNGMETKYFIKIPTTDSSVKLIQMEKINLDYLNILKFNCFEVPKVALSDGELIAISNIKPKRGVSNKDFSSVHFNALLEIYNKTFKKYKNIDIKSINDSILRQQSLSNFNFDRGNELHQKIGVLTKKLLILKKILMMNNDIKTSFAHCDFTPWNMYITKERLFVYDWEMGEDMPLLFDFFHYIFQQNILVKQNTYHDIKGDILSLTKNNVFKKIIKNYDIDLNIYFGYYLMINVSYYALKYINQEDLHTQAHWLIKIWNIAIEDFVERKGRVF